MTRIRFAVRNGDDVQLTPWVEETVQFRQQGEPTAVAQITQLRREHPLAAISVEREGEERKPKKPTFRFKVFVKDDRMLVIDGIDGKHDVAVKGVTVLSRPFYEHEQEQVLSEVRKQFPSGQIVEVING